MQTLAVSAAALAVSFVFSMMGAGGSQILVPVLFWIGLDFKAAAIPLALLASAITCFSSGAVYWKRGLVRLDTAAPFALAVLAGSPVGALLSRTTSSEVLMIVFAVTNMLIGLFVLKGRSVVGEGLSPKAEQRLSLVIGLGVGFFIGYIARDGGPFVMAILVLLGYDAKKAAGTAPVIIAAGCLAAFGVHAFNMAVTWPQVLGVAAASLVGSQAGSRFMTERMEARSIKVLFATVMVAVGVVILVQAF